MTLSLRQRKMLWGYAFVSIPLIYFLIVFVIPMGQAFQFSVLKYSTLSVVKTYVGAQNYLSMLDDAVFWKAFGNTIRYTLFRAPIVLILGLITALLFQNLKRLKNGLRTVLILPFMTSLVAMGWLWLYLYSRTGPITLALEAMGVENARLLLYPQTALYSIAAVTVWGSLGYYMLLLTVGLDSIPEDFYDAAKVDGASAWQAFRHVTLPLLNPTIVLVSIIAVTASLKNFDVIRTMAATGGPLNSTLTLPLMIYMEAFTRLNMGRAAAITVVFFIIILIITYIQLRTITREIEF